MATPIPGLASQIVWVSGSSTLASTPSEYVRVNSATDIGFARTRFYYFVSNRTSAGNGQSFLRALKDNLDASLAGTTWTVRLTKVSGLYKVQLSHNNGSSRTITFTSAAASPTLPLKLGFASSSVVVAASTTVTADYPSVWWWTPDMPVSLTGPEMFDPALTHGIPESAGFSQRSSDSTGAYGQHGTQWSADYYFNGVQYYYKIRPVVGHTNEDLETWWINGPMGGAIRLPIESGPNTASNRFLWWRDRDNACGSDAPSAGSASPYNYIEYQPGAVLRTRIPVTYPFPNNLVFADVKIDCWVTENEENVLSA